MFFVGNKLRPTRRLFGNLTTADFRQIRPRYARKSWVKRRLGTEIYEKFPFRGHLPQKPKTLRGSNRYLCTSLRAGYRSRDTHCREILFIPRCSPRAREFSICRQLFCTTYGCGATTGLQSCPIFGFWPIFLIQNP